MKFGRLPRIHNPRVPLLSNILRVKPTPTLPPTLDYLAGMSANLGYMLNDQLGDCVEAAAGHSIQIWTYNAQDGSMVTPPDSAIEVAYEQWGGYVPGNPNTDQGTVIQTALLDWLTEPVNGNSIVAFVEIDQTDTTTVKTMIYEAGLAFIGFEVPEYFIALENPGSVWDVDPQANGTIIAGHCVPLVGWDAIGNYIVESWGSIYYMTPAFFAEYCDEAYALADPGWIEKTGLSPAGLSLAQLVALMQGGVPAPNAPSAPTVS